MAGHLEAELPARDVSWAAALRAPFDAGCSFREIAAITGVPAFTAASRCRLALARLRRLMGGSR